MGSRCQRGSKGCGGTVAISWPVPGTPTSRPGPRPRPHALVNLLPTSSRRGAHLFCASLARVSSVPPTLCRTVSPTFGSKFIPCGTALLSARLRILVPCYLEATPAPLLFSGSREDKQSRPPERSQRPRSRRKKWGSDFDCVKSEHDRAKNGDNKENRSPTLMQRQQFLRGQLKKESEARPSRNGTSSSPLTLEVFPGSAAVAAGQSVRRPRRGLRRGGQ